MYFGAHPNLVCEFYENAKVGINSIESEVKKVKITFNVDQLGHVLKAPASGSNQLKGKRNRLHIVLDREDVIDLKRYWQDNYMWR